MNKASQLLAEANALAEQHRRLDAVDLLQAGNVGLLDAGVEIRLAELRRDAVVEIPEVDTHPVPQFDDPFPGHSGLIEINREDATPEVVGGAVQHHGCVLVRGLLSPEAATHLAQDIEHSFDALKAAHDGAPPSETRPWYVPLAPHPDLPSYVPEQRANLSYYRVCTVDSPRTMFDVVDTYERAGIHDIARAFLGARPVHTSQKWALRRMPKRSIYGWHQEASVFDSGPLRAINVWMSLTECGVDSPGFDVLPRREPEIIPADRGFMLTEETFDRVRDCDFASPLYQPGDAMIFDEYLIHRTNTNQSMPGERTSIESWYFTRGSKPAGRDAVVL